MLKKTKLIVSAATLAVVAAGVFVPLFIVQNAQQTPSAPQNQQAKQENGAGSAVPKTSYAADRLNPLPGPDTAQADLVPPTPPVFTDNVTITYQSTVLPLPKLPVPAPGYGSWNPRVEYVSEADNSQVSSERLPSLAAGTVVVAIATTAPAVGHTGPSYSAFVRFVIQKLPVRQQRSAELSATRYAVMTELARGKLPAELLQEFMPRSLADQGYFPWSVNRLSKRFVDKGGRTYPLDTAADWAYLVNKFQNANDSDLFSISYLWQTEPDFNHYAEGWDGIVNYDYRFEVSKRAQVQTTVASASQPLDYREYVVDGRPASFKTMNQFGTIVYDVDRSVTGEPIGEIIPAELPEASLQTLADGKQYPVYVSGTGQDNELYDYWQKRFDPNKQYYAGQDDMWKGASFISKSMVTSKATLPGTDFNIFNAIPSNSAIAAVPLVSVEYEAKNAEAAIRLLAQLDISYNFVNSAFFVSPDQPVRRGSILPTVNSIQKFLTHPGQLASLADTAILWYDKSAYAEDILVNNPNEWPRLTDYTPATINTNYDWESPESKSLFANTQYQYRKGLSTQAYFNFSKLDRYSIEKGQFFDVADLSFVPNFENYSEMYKNLLRSRLFDPDSTRLRVGAYVEYKNGKLLMHLVPYVSNLPKISFASLKDAFQINRNVAFSYQFQNVRISLDANNDSTLGWWS